MDRPPQIPESPPEAMRLAASLLREGAAKATPGPWEHMCLGSEGCLVLRPHTTIRERHHGRVAQFGCKDWQADHADAVYVAMMAPPVAAALADWLDAAAQAWDEGMEWPGALNVTRAFFGGEA